MDLPEEFLTLYSGLSREGPGLPEDVLWALSLAGTPERAEICDAGCGSGADTATLAEARPEAQIDAIDITTSLVSQARARLARFGARVRVIEGDMAHLPGRYELIWCAGAAYFIGVGAALQTWRSALKDGGRVAFSHPVYPRTPPSPMAEAFWQGELAQVGDRAETEAQIAAAGYRILGSRLLIGPPWSAYYASLEARIATLRAATPSAALSEVLDTSAREIALWRAAPDEIAYALFVVQPQ